MSYFHPHIRSHSHILFLRNLSQHFQTYLQEKPFEYIGLLLCDFCGQRFRGCTSIYCCELCAFYLHTSCASPPALRQIHNPRHKHLLDLQVPGEMCNYSLYRCVEFNGGCDFELGTGIAMKALWVEKYYCSMLREAGDRESRLQFAHEHPLTSFPARSRLFCGGCEMQISEEEAYGCSECNFFLHEACAKAPPVVENHPFHPEHRLHLRCCPGVNLFYETETLACYLCGSQSSIGYSCHNCEFFLDLSCVISTMPCEDDDEREDSRERSSTMNHFLESLHPHQLSSYHSKTQIKIVCEICCEVIRSGNFLGCLNCRFFLHESCAQPPMEIKHYLHPEHTLTFAKCPGEKEHECPICESRVRNEAHCYTCQMCDFCIHQACASASLSDLESGVGTTVQFSLHEHELKLHYNVIQPVDCIVCEKIISYRPPADQEIGELIHSLPYVFHLLLLAMNHSRAYKCISQGCEFKFKLHKSCAQLPSKLGHPSHSLHPLTLGIKPPNEDILCRCCSSGIRGLYAFSCGECNFYLHVACAQKPALKHPFHEHILFYFEVILEPVEDFPDTLCFFECKACRRSCIIDFFRCVECDYTLHYECSQLLPTIKSEHHSDPLVLRESVIEDDSGEYYCDICERRRDPMKWVYFCETDKCELIAHVNCAVSPVKLEVIEEDDFICQKEDIRKREEEIKRAQEQADAKEGSLRPLMVELESMRAKVESQRGALEELKAEHAKWMDMEAIKENTHARGHGDSYLYT